MSDAPDKSTKGARPQIKSPYNRNPIGKGGFQKGKSGNPGGKPAGLREFALAAREHSKESLEKLVWLMRNGENHSVQLAATKEILLRAWGAPLGASDQFHLHLGAEESKTSITVRFVPPDPKPLPPLDHSPPPLQRR